MDMATKFAWGSAVSLIAAGFASAGVAQARDNYGAIAYSNTTGANGYSYDYPSRAAAESAALAKCNANDCAIPLWFKNACGALAVGANGGFGTAWGTTRARAENTAVRTCNNYTSSSGCSVATWVCTTR